MRPTLKRFIGVSFILLAIIGILFSLAGIWGTWRVRTIILVKFFETSELLQSSLGATADGLEIIDQTLDTATATMDSTERVTRSVSLTMKDMNTVTSGLLNLLILIPGGQLPGLNPGETSTNLSIAETELSQMGTQIHQVSEDLGEAQIVVSRYRTVINDTQNRVRVTQINAPQWITAATWATTMILIWLAALQVILVIQGIDYFIAGKTNINSH